MIGLIVHLLSKTESNRIDSRAGTGALSSHGSWVWTHYGAQKFMKATTRYALTFLLLTIVSGLPLYSQTKTVEKIVPTVSWENPGPPGTYWSMQLDQAPLPGNPFPELEIIELDATNHIYAINDLNVDYEALSQQMEVEAALWKGTMLSFEFDNESGGGMMSMLYGYSTDDLALELGSMTNGLINFVVWPPEIEATNGVYDLYSTTNLNTDGLGLNGTNWMWLLRTATGQTNLVVSNLTDEACFFRLGRTNDTDEDGLSDAFENLVSHSDFNNGDQNTNGIPDGWEWYNFGNLNQTANGDYDTDGLSNLYEYNAGTDPNTIRFTVDFDDLRVGVGGALGTFSILSGMPIHIGVLVDSTNFAAASWFPYTSSFSPDLGSTDGTKNIWFTLKGRASTSQPYSWQQFHFRRDTTPPSIVITNPAMMTVLQPVIQLQGYSPEPLSRLRYDVTNALGSLTNQEGYVTTQWFDTNLFELTTNWFACLDIPLTSGTNTVFLYATDLAGNISSNVYSYVLDYSNATNPIIKLYWPLDGTEISGGDFTCRGWVDDPAATVFGSLVNTNGTTSTFALVERDGKFWAENLPLASGTNNLTLMVTNSAGLTSVTNITVVKSDLLLTMDDHGDLWQPTTGINGTISDSSYAVWVNGVQAIVNSDGTWTASGVPVNEGGTASFVITAYAPGEQQPGGPP